MPHTTISTIQIPFTIAGQIHLTNVPTAPLRLLLVAESYRQPGDDVVDMPVAMARAMAGMTARTFHDSVVSLSGLRARSMAATNDVSEAAEDLRRIVPFAEVPRKEYDGDDERLRIRFSESWVIAARGESVVLPLDEVRAFRTRAGLLMRLRAGALVHLRDKGRRRIEVDDLPLLTGAPLDLKPADHWRRYIAPGYAEVEQVSSTVEIHDMHTTATKAGYIRAVVMQARRLENRHAGKRMSPLADIRGANHRM